LTKATTAGITCPVNVELNRETFDAGPGAIIDLARRTGARTFEFDFSVQFDDFRTKPAFRKGNYPMLPGSLSYLEFRTFVVGLRREIISQGLQGSITSNLLRDMSERKMDMAFNVCREADFVTVNPDSTVTTNPLFSDIPETYIGSLEEQGLDRILAHPNRRDRIAYEQDRRSVCKGCEFVEICEGGPSHVPVEDGSGECAGLKGLLHRLSVGCAAR
jgi:radical SAM protein with 4Fe4S-binding SPASM domain